MNSHEKFNFKNIKELLKKSKELKVSIPYSEDISKLRDEVKLSNGKILNRMVVNPMEGCDGELDGSPGKLTYRRYKRFAKGGAGLLWFEATAVVPEGRANPRQLAINEKNVDKFKDLVEFSLSEGKKANGSDYEPYKVLQLTHSGRYSRPVKNMEPIIPVNNPFLEKKEIHNYHIISDKELELLENKFVNAAKLAKEAGFDAVDIKSCHRYLCSELLSSYTRKGKYGGSFENRTRFLFNVIDKIKEELGESIGITVRLNVYDAHPYPYGFGVSKEESIKPDLEEPIRLIKELSKRKVEIINVTAGNPYYNPHIGRPYDVGPYIPKEHPLESIARFMEFTKTISKEVPEMKIIAPAFTWLREFAPNIMAGAIEKGYCQLAGFGRQSFAYPNFARDIINNEALDPKKCCITCSKCTEMMRYGGVTGCVIHDKEIYLDEYLKCRAGKPTQAGKGIANHL